MIISKNVANISGGGIYLEDDECKWCTLDKLCTNIGNTAPFGAEEAASAAKMTVIWPNRTRYTFVDLIEVEASIYDTYGQKVSAFEKQVTLKIDVFYSIPQEQIDYPLSTTGGTGTLVSFANGTASASFSFESDQLITKNAEIGLTLVAIASIADEDG